MLASATILSAAGPCIDKCAKLCAPPHELLMSLRLLYLLMVRVCHRCKLSDYCAIPFAPETDQQRSWGHHVVCPWNVFLASSGSPVLGSGSFHQLMSFCWLLFVTYPVILVVDLCCLTCGQLVSLDTFLQLTRCQSFLLPPPPPVNSFSHPPSPSFSLSPQSHSDTPFTHQLHSQPYASCTDGSVWAVKRTSVSFHCYRISLPHTALQRYQTGAVATLTFTWPLETLIMVPSCSVRQAW